MGFEKYKLHPMILKGLTQSKFTEPTLVQKKIVPLALTKRSIVCSAKTGSGKTLAFVIPVLQRLLSAKWEREDGLGALVITPTRELAFQIFEVFQSVGKYTNLSGGLLIGGRNAEKEKDKVAMLNVVVCTPGRLLEHLESVWNFSGDNLEVLVIDEADKLMEMGFKQSIDRILEYITKKRQTLLFSATTNAITKAKKLWDVESPEFVCVKDEGVEEIGSRLEQKAFYVTPSQKFDLLYRTIKTNLLRKTIVFLSTCKEVSFFYALFKKLRLGLPLLYLSGNMSQKKRVETYEKFCRSEPKLLFSTDISARGLDFPNVNLVLQLDAPDSPETHTHRIGRTARNKAKGKAVTVLLRQEESLAAALKQTPGFPEIRPFKSSRTIEDRVRAILKNVPEIYLLAQKYVKTYKGFLRVAKKEYAGDVDARLAELVAYLGVEEDENVAWSQPAKKKSKLLSSRITFE
ncbi:ATP-dependent RNA helicase DDX1/DBP4 [Nematocida displodere]|uniref:ATP-dependent RNA helicase n=1 Tax=Nematocida displodere TaxID=1805483 RepID=A0A177EEN4_9MICR|nr:ATP-dependent RNA helicase DDX1/DBP4 [Nematocida displodere]